MSTTSNPVARELLRFIDSSPSPFHVVKECQSMLLANGFLPLEESSQWKLQKGCRYFVTRNDSTLFAFSIGINYEKGNGITMAATHTDSPCLRVKPKFFKLNSTFHQAAVQTYGGGLWHTWFDRDLSIAGRVITETASGTLKSQLVDVKRAILKIPSLAIHLDRTVDKDGFKFNNETHLLPIAGQSLFNETNSLAEIISRELKLDSDDSIVDMELCLYDTQPSAIGGVNDEFVFASRIDNLLMTFCALKGFTQTTFNAQSISILALFDNEEVGSTSAQGADSALSEQVISRILQSLDPGFNQIQQVLANSFLISADCAHSVHPNYAGLHDDLNKPILNCGIAIKYNANQRYSTTSITASVIKRLCNKYKIPFQEFCSRNDVPCGTTIGPLLSAGLAIPSVDIGLTQLSMHSIRETCGSKDIGSAIELFSKYFFHGTQNDLK